MKGNQILFKVEAADRIVVNCFESWECRGECALELFCDLVQNWPQLLVGRSGGISFRDCPPDQDWVDSLDLAFSATKRIGQPSACLPFPCPYTLRWPQVGIPDAESLMAELLVADSPYNDERMFWIGANSHSSRVKLCEIGRKFPNLFDTEMIQWDTRAPGGQRSKTRQVSLQDHARYKYLIDCPGNGYSARIKWLLAMGRPLFIVERQFVEHWHEQLQPWVHYVPVTADLSDLMKHYERLESDEKLYMSLSINARRFAAEYLSVDARLIHVADALQNHLSSISKTN